jgi:transposase
MVQLGELMMILELHRQGLSITAIARRTGRDPKTVRKYVERGVGVASDSQLVAISHSAAGTRQLREASRARLITLGGFLIVGGDGR